MSQVAIVQGQVAPAPAKRSDDPEIRVVKALDRVEKFEQAARPALEIGRQVEGCLKQKRPDWAPAVANAEAFMATPAYQELAAQVVELYKPANKQSIGDHIEFLIESSPHHAGCNRNSLKLALTRAVLSREPSRFAVSRTCREIQNNPRPRFKLRWDQPEVLEELHESETWINLIHERITELPCWTAKLKIEGPERDKEWEMQLERAAARSKAREAALKEEQDRWNAECSALIVKHGGVEDAYSPANLNYLPGNINYYAHVRDRRSPQEAEEMLEKWNMSDELRQDIRELVKARLLRLQLIG